MTGVRGQSGREPKTWAVVHRKSDGAYVEVAIPRSVLVQAGVNPDDTDLIVNRRAMSGRRSVVLEFKTKAQVPEGERR